MRHTLFIVLWFVVRLVGARLKRQQFGSGSNAHAANAHRLEGGSCRKQCKSLVRPVSSTLRLYDDESTG